MSETNDFRDLSRLIKPIGILLLLVGVIAVFIGPLEIYAFYLFSEGGKFHYEGFGFGSFMFGNIATQVIGYYAIAGICIFLGYGHLKIQPWTRKITLTLFWDWLIFGLPLSIIFFLMLVTSKDLPPSTLPILLVGFILLYPILPVLLILLYRNRNVRLTFQELGSGSDWTHPLTDSVLVLVSLLVIIILGLHVPLFFNGIFPLFGMFLFGLQGILLLDLSILFLTLMSWGIIKRKLWAWWGTLLYLLSIAISATVSFLTVSPIRILENMKFPEFELEILQNVPVQGYHLASMIVLPVVITLVFQIASRRHYWRSISIASDEKT